MSFREKHASLLIYIFPCIMDILLGLYRFVCMVRVDILKGTATDVAGILIINGIGYMVASQLVGKFVNSKNAANMMIWSCILNAAVCVLFLYFSTIYGMYVLMVVASFATALFFTPFQVFMKVVDGKKKKPIARSVGMYTFSWSTGIALGPFVSGFFMDMGEKVEGAAETDGWKMCYYFGIIMAVLLGAGIYAFRKHALEHKDDTQQEAKSDTRKIDYHRLPDLAWLGWVCSGIGCMLIMLLQTVFTKEAGDMNFLNSTKGTTLFLMCFVQALTGLALRRTRTWMYEGWKVGMFGLVGLLGIMLFALGGKPYIFYIAACLTGIYSGSFFFYLVFHSLTHPSRSSRYVAINESVVGIAGILGPLLGGLIVDCSHSYSKTYLTGAAILLLTAIFQIITHYRKVQSMADVKRITAHHLKY